MRYLIAIAVGMLMVTNPATPDERQLIMAGAGAHSCGKFIANMELDEIFHDLYFFWAQGFLSGLNFKYFLNQESATDLADHDALQLWLENYCDENPLDQYSAAAMQLWHELRVRQGLDPDPVVSPKD